MNLGNQNSKYSWRIRDLEKDLSRIDDHTWRMSHCTSRIFRHEQRANYRLPCVILIYTKNAIHPKTLFTEPKKNKSGATLNPLHVWQHILCFEHNAHRIHWNKYSSYVDIVDLQDFKMIFQALEVDHYFCHIKYVKNI